MVKFRVGPAWGWGLCIMLPSRSHPFACPAAVCRGGQHPAWFPVQSTGWSVSTSAAELASPGQALSTPEHAYGLHTKHLVSNIAHEPCPRDSSLDLLSVPPFSGLFSPSCRPLLS